MHTNCVYMQYTWLLLVQYEFVNKAEMMVAVEEAVKKNDAARTKGT